MVSLTDPPARRRSLVGLAPLLIAPLAALLLIVLVNPSLGWPLAIIGLGLLWYGADITLLTIVRRRRQRIQELRSAR